MRGEAGANEGQHMDDQRGEWRKGSVKMSEEMEMGDLTVEEQEGN